MLRKCTACGKNKTTDAFPQVREGVWRSLCRVCFNVSRTLAAGAPRQIKAPPPPPPGPVEKDHRKTAPRARIYLVTWAQNATPVHGPFLAALETYARERSAELLITPGRYHNPTSTWSREARRQDWWAPETAPYLFRGKTQIGPHLAVHGDISIQPTATRPLSGFEAYAETASAIFGHPKLEAKTVATAKRRYPRMFATTGACTIANYIAAKAGKKAAAAHHLGALVVERAPDGLFHLRHVSWHEASGTFTDLAQRYSPDGVTVAPRPAGLILGDIHDAKRDPAVLAASLTDEDSIFGVLDPEELIVHDVLDFDTRNHHNRGDFRQAYDRSTGARPNDVRAEVVSACAFLAEVCPIPPIVVASNHDEAFDRWLREAEPLKDPINALFYFQSWTKIMERRALYGQWTGAFEAWCTALHGEKTARFLARDEPHKIGEIYVNFHGDRGINGARGTLAGYAKLGVQTVTGHSHSPGIEDRAWAAGVTGDLSMGYNHLPSSWLNTHVLIYADGNRTLLTVIKDRGGKAHWKAG